MPEPDSKDKPVPEITNPSSMPAVDAAAPAPFKAIPTSNKVEGPETLKPAISAGPETLKPADKATLDSAKAVMNNNTTPDKKPATPPVKSTVQAAKPSAASAPAVKVSLKAAAPKTPLKAVAKAVTPAAAVKPVTSKVDAGGLIPQSEINKMQQDAAGIPPAAVVETGKGSNSMETPAGALTAPKTVFEQNKFNRVMVNVMFTLNLTDDRMYDTRSTLSSVKLEDGTACNLYSPFRKAGKKKTEDDTTAALEGIVRHALDTLMDITDEINNSKVVFLGKSSESAKVLKGAIEGTRAQVEALLPLKAKKTLFSVREEKDGSQVIASKPETLVGIAPELLGEGEVAPVYTDVNFSDVIQVRSWINSPEPTSEDSEALHNAVINFVVNAGAFYDAPERGNYLGQVETVLRLITKFRAEGNTNLVLSVNMDSSSLSDAPTREFIEQMLADDNFILYTRRELHFCDLSDWLPQTKESVDADLLSGTGDLLFVKLLSDAAVDAPV